MNTFSNKAIGWLTQQAKPKKKPVLLVINTGVRAIQLSNQLWEGTGND